VSRCFFHDFAPPGLRDCDGRIQNHHAITQARIKDLLKPRRVHLMEDSELRERKALLSKALKDPRNRIDACVRHHQLWHNGRIVVPRDSIPSSLEQFAQDYELVWDLDRQFGVGFVPEEATQ
jgi:hypothetical protein